jgi:DNA-binding NarL/FixJ family response regulator
VRAVIAEDLALLRDGLARILRAHDIDVAAAVGDPVALAAALEEQQPDIAIVDVRMPPTFTNEGLVAAIEARARRPGMPVLVLSQYVEQLYARELLLSGAVLDPDVVTGMLTHHDRSQVMARLTPREREVLGLMAEGRSNAAIAGKLFVTAKAVDKHINSIFMKLDLPLDADDNRRVLAVLRYLQTD